MLLGELDLNAAPAVGALEKATKAMDKTAAKGGELGKGLGQMAGNLPGLVVGFFGLSKVMETFHGALDLGGTLNDLSLRTGESVGDLVKLRESFQEAGLGADGVEGFILKLDNALGGVNEEGNKTSDAFEALGTSAEALQNLDATGKLQAIQKGLAGIHEQASKVQVLRNLFGRSGGQMLSLLGDPDALGAGSKHAEALAAIAEKAVPGMDALGDSLDAAKLHIQELAFGALNQLAPALTDMVQRWDDIDFVKIGEGFSSLVSPIIEVANAVRTTIGVMGAMFDYVLDHTMGTQAPALSGYDKAGVERRRALGKNNAGGGASQMTPATALQRIGGGYFGGAGGGDPLLAEAQRHGHILLRIESHLRTGGIKTGSIQGPPV